MDASPNDLFTPARLGPIELKNRFIKAATFEGMTRDGVPGEKLTAFHRRLAEGDLAMTTLAYCATEADGRLHDEMMYLHRGIEGPLRQLVDTIHGAGAKVSGQVVHCGGFSKNRKLQRLKRPLAPSRGVNLLGTPAGMPIAGAMGPADIDAFVQTFTDAGRLLKDVGFDAAEIHFGHGYGISQFISPKTNRRTDEYGGSLENRMRLPLRVLEAFREGAGDGLAVIGKISMTDGVKGGVTWDEGVKVAAMLDAAGIDGIVTSAGTSSFNPMLMFHGESMAHGMIEQEKNPITRLGLKMLGPKLFKEYPYKEIYLLEHAKRVREAVRCPVVYIGGCATRESAETLMREGFDFIQLGRTLLEDPDFVKHAQEDPKYVNGCNHCNRCVGLIDHPDGIRCVLHDAA
jgi:2,4-dienoyl-CoA reductase-like NADH-dependent reductase (Old Yellow Enzyme family)